MIDEKLLMAFADLDRFAFWTEEKVRYQDLDTNSHINNIAYLSYVEGARIEYRRHCISQLGEKDWGAWVVAASAIKFLKTGGFPGHVKVGTAPLQVGRTSFSLGYGIFQDGECLAVAGSRSVQVDRETGKPAPLPEDFRELLSRSIAD